MNKRKKNFLKLLLASCIAASMLSASRPLNVEAAGADPKNVNILPSSGSKTEGIFDRDDGFWYPGRTLSKDFYIQNDNSESITFYEMDLKVLELRNLDTNKVLSPGSQEYADFFKSLKLSLECDGKVIYCDDFSKAFSDNISFKDKMKVDGNSKKNFKMTLTMDPQSGNNLQNQSHSFNFGITYVMDDGSSISVMPKTGSRFDASLLLCTGIFVLGIGYLVFTFKSKDKDNASSNKGGM